MGHPVVFSCCSAAHSVFLTPPRMVGLVSEAHLAMAEKTLPMPVSFGFSRPRIARCFITDTNSWEGREGHTW